MRNVGGLGVTVLVVVFLSSCHIVSKKRETVPGQTGASESVLEQNNQTVDSFQKTLSTLNRIINPIDTQINSSMSQNGQTVVNPEREKELFLVNPSSQASYSNVFALSAELFSEVGVGNMDYSSTTGTYTQEFESLSARRMTQGRVRVLLVVYGQGADNDQGQAQALSIKVVEGVQEKEFFLYRKGNLQGKDVLPSQKQNGFNTGLLLSLDNLEKFYDEMDKYLVLSRNIKLAGNILSMSNDEGAKRYYSTNLLWSTFNYQLLVDELDMVNSGSGSFKDLGLNAVLQDSDGERLGELLLNVKDLGEDNQKFWADIKMKDRNEI